MDPYLVARERSRVLHVAVGQRLSADPNLVDAARIRVQEWIAEGTVDRRYAEPWLELLAHPLPELLAALADPSERMHTLRQVSPFAGILDPRTRWRIHDQTSASRK